MDWNDLHVSHGLGAVESQLLAAVAGVDWDNLPRTPSIMDATPPELEPSSPGGTGEADLSSILRRFALIEGKTSVFDLFRKIIVKKTAFEALVTKPLAKDFYASADKKLISEEQAQRIETKARLSGKNEKIKAQGMSPLERYVYLDGTQDVWDKLRRRRVPVAALRVALGELYPDWLNSPDRAEIDQDNLVFDPRMLLDPASHINTFEGLPLQPIDNPDLCRGIRFLIDFLCNNDKAAAHWLTCWLAYPLQRLGTKMDSALLLHSTMEGSGKSLLLSDVMAEIYGIYRATVGQAQLESGWTAWQSSKLYAVFEEVVSRDQRFNQSGKIKHLITGKTARMESKFVNGWEEANYMNPVFLSNEMMPWPISENDRRFFVMWPREELPLDRQKRVAWELANGGPAAFYDWLLKYDCGDFNERTKPPHTEARKWLIEVSRAAWETFIHQWLNGLLGVPCSVVLTTDLYGLYRAWCSKSGEHAMSETKFILFSSRKVDKSSGLIPWTDGAGKRRFGSFFVRDPPDDLDISSSKQMGQYVRDFRNMAHIAEWNPESWPRISIFSAPDEVTVRDLLNKYPGFGGRNG